MRNSMPLRFGLNTVDPELAASAGGFGPPIKSPLTEADHEDRRQKGGQENHHPAIPDRLQK